MTLRHYLVLIIKLLNMGEEVVCMGTNIAMSNASKEKIVSG